MRNREAYNAYQKEYQKRRYHKRVAEAKEILGNACAVCGAKDVPLQFDHADRKDKQFDISTLWSVAEKRFYAELGSCQLLCEPCHKAKSNKERSCPIKIAGVEFTSISEACRMLKIGYDKAIAAGEFLDT